MSTDNNSAAQNLDPGGLWRCNICGGLVEEFGTYACGVCIGFKTSEDV